MTATSTSDSKGIISTVHDFKLEFGSTILISSPVNRLQGFGGLLGKRLPSGPIPGLIKPWLSLTNISCANNLSGPAYKPVLASLNASIALCVLPELVGPK